MTNDRTVEHHIKYKEIHGYDETVIMPRGEHIKLHNRLRRKGKCDISVKELKRISNKAYQRTDKAKEQQQEYYKNLSDKQIIRRKEYNIEYKKNNKEKAKISNKIYRESHKEQIAAQQKTYRELRKTET